jgi:hypothetical protein
MKLTKRCILMAMIGCCQTFAQANSPAIAKKKIEKLDYSVLTTFKDALLDLKGAVETGVNREDYQHKLQTAAGERLKAKDRLPDGDSNPVRVRFFCYGIVLAHYDLAAGYWDLLLEEDDVPTDAAKTKAALHELWGIAGHALDTVKTCTAKEDPSPFLEGH